MRRRGEGGVKRSWVAGFRCARLGRSGRAATTATASSWRSHAAAATATAATAAAASAATRERIPRGCRLHGGDGSLRNTSGTDEFRGFWQDGLAGALGASGAGRDRSLGVGGRCTHLRLRGHHRRIGRDWWPLVCRGRTRRASTRQHRGGARHHGRRRRAGGRRLRSHDARHRGSHRVVKATNRCSWVRRGRRRRDGGIPRHRGRLCGGLRLHGGFLLDWCARHRRCSVGRRELIESASLIFDVAKW